MFRLVFVLALLGFVPVTAWWKSLPELARGMLVASLAVIVLSSLALLLLWNHYRRQRRALAWKRAIAAWERGVQARVGLQQRSVRALSDRELEDFARQVHAEMGYQVRRTGQSGDHGVDVRLVNPERQVELVQCKQWRKPVGEPAVRDLYGAMAHAGAVRGWLWAPGGFSAPARRWAHGKPIVLVDEEEIGRLVESVYRG